VGNDMSVTAPAKLLARDEFREAVWARDHDTCVCCPLPAVDAHHILERRLWPDGGYYLGNGASLCAVHHLEAEQTVISCESLRRECGIGPILLPPHLDPDESYDKWGNAILPNGQRLRGELFDDESVQKILAPVLHLFTNRVKYPRTFHLPWSGKISADDRVVDDADALFSGRQVVVTAKMDGENTTLYRDGMHARSIDGRHRPEQEFVRAMHGAIAHDIPENWRVCGENLYAKHAIHYQHLASYFQVFSIWNDKNTCLSWDETVEWAALLGLQTVPVLYRGEWSNQVMQTCAMLRTFEHGDLIEGHVVRLADGFRYRDFRKSTAKYVRPDHVAAHGGGVIVANELEA
jgi:hypothetical protein